MDALIILLDCINMERIEVVERVGYVGGPWYVVVAMRLALWEARLNYNVVTLQQSSWPRSSAEN